MAKTPVDGQVIANRFSPNGGVTDLICQTIHSAKHDILVMAYEFTSFAIAQALIDAITKRKVSVKLINDKLASATRGAQWPALLRAGANVVLDGKHRIMHDKTMVIDGRQVLTGSFNFTLPAELDHAENLSLIEGDWYATSFANNFNAHLTHSVVATQAHLDAHAAAAGVLPEQPIAPEQLDVMPTEVKAFLALS